MAKLASVDLPSESTSIEERLQTLHDELLAELPGVARIALAVYDEKTDSLKTFAHSTRQGTPLLRHEAKLAQVPSLKELATHRRDRVISDTAVLAGLPTRHSQAVAGNWGSSYTRPIFEGQRLRGFLFFDAVERAYFAPPVVLRLAVYSELMTLMLASSLFPARLLHSAVEVASTMSHERDPETGAHLDRMSRYSRLVALGVAQQYELSDVFIEHVLLFAPLHDIGKVAIPDHILLKTSRLNPEEFAVMKTHVTRGGEIVDRLLERLSLRDEKENTMLRNIVLGHHEAWDGSGYPHGLRGETIPIEARIVAVADVYDALTSERPYKAAWSADAAYAYLRERAGKHFDARCVTAMEGARATVEEIRHTFVDAPGAIRLREGYVPEL